MKTKLAFSFIICVTPALASELAAGYRCAASQKPETLVQKLLETNNIESKPFDNRDGITSYAARPNLTVFGLPLVSISAWQPNSKLFVRAPGTAPNSHYAFVVQANAWELKQAAQRQGVKMAAAQELNSFPYVEIRPFNAEYQDSLPVANNKRMAYAQITCNVE